MSKLKGIIKYGMILSVVILVAIIGTILFRTYLKNNKEKEVYKSIYGNITFTSNRTDKEEELNNLINNFENLYPNINVNLELIGDAEAVLQRKASVGELSDITMVPSSIVNTSELSNYFLPIDDIGIDEDTIYNYWGGVGSDGVLYNITSSITWVGVLYNKKIFNEAGITTTPNTNSEFFEACRKINDIGITSVALNYMNPWTMGTWIDIIPYLLDTNLEEDVIKGHKEILSYESGVYQSLEFARQIVENNYCEENLLNYNWEVFKKDMAAGKIAMTIWSSDLLNQLEDLGASSDAFGMFVFPESKRIVINGDYKYAIAKNTKYEEAAKIFFKYLFLEGNYYKAVNVTSPIMNDGSEDGGLLNELKVYNIPIVFESKLSNDNFADGVTYHDSYNNIRKSTVFDYSKVQEYLTTNNIDALIRSINDSWNKEITEIMN